MPGVELGAPLGASLRGPIATSSIEAVTADISHRLEVHDDHEEKTNKSKNDSKDRKGKGIEVKITPPSPSSTSDYPIPPRRSTAGTEQDKADRDTLANLQKNFPRSPVVPQSLAEYLSLKKEISKDKQQETKGKQKLASGSPAEHHRMIPRLSEKLIRVTDEDGLSCVTSRNTIWTNECIVNGHIDWPEDYESYKSKPGKIFPAPRVQLLDEKYANLMEGPNPLPKYGPGVPPQYRALATFALLPIYDGMTEFDAEEVQEPSEEIKSEELDGYTQELLKEIDED